MRQPLSLTAHFSVNRTRLARTSGDGRRCPPPLSAKPLKPPRQARGGGYATRIVAALGYMPLTKDPTMKKSPNEPRTAPHAQGIGGGYPQLVARLAPAVYLRQPVVFVTDPLRLGRDTETKRYAVLDPDPGAGRELTPARRQAVVEAAGELCDHLQLPCCAAFSPRDAVYFRPDQAQATAAQAPAGGLALDEVRFVGRPGVTH